MARNEEKAKSMLYRFREAMKSAEEIDNPRINFSEPPPDPNTLQNTKQLIKWRDFLLRDISRKVGSMGTSSMSDTQVMDLNDEINKLVRTKNAFDRRIMELGGEKIASLPGKDTYVYYGRAKDLPGVKESLTEKEAMINMESEEAQPDEEKISKKGDIIKSLDAQYYGYRDEEEDDEEAMEILKLEEAAEKFFKEKLSTQNESTSSDKIYCFQHIPSQKEIEAYLLEKKKEDLIKSVIN